MFYDFDRSEIDSFENIVKYKDSTKGYNISIKWIISELDVQVFIKKNTLINYNFKSSIFSNDMIKENLKWAIKLNACLFNDSKLNITLERENSDRIFFQKACIVRKDFEKINFTVRNQSHCDFEILADKVHTIINKGSLILIINLFFEAKKINIGNIAMHVRVPEQVTAIETYSTKKIMDELTETKLSDKHLKAHTQDFNNLLEEGIFSDITINVGYNTISAHKNILATRSAFFNKILMHKNNKNISEIDITDINNPEAVLILLKYIYTGKLNKNFDVELAKDLLAGASKFLLSDIIPEVEDYLVKNVVIDNVIDLFLLADTCNAKHLKNVAFSFIIENFKTLCGENFNKIISKNAILLKDIVDNYVTKNADT